VSGLVHSGRFSKTGWYSIPNLGSFRSAVHSESEPKTGRLSTRITGEIDTGDPWIGALEAREILFQVSPMLKPAHLFRGLYWPFADFTVIEIPLWKHGDSETTPLTIFKPLSV